MGLILTFAVAAVLWVVMWSLDVKAWDGFMLFLIIVLGAATVRVIAPYLPGNRDPDERNPDPAPYN